MQAASELCKSQIKVTKILIMSKIISQNPKFLHLADYPISAIWKIKTFFLLPVHFLTYKENIIIHLLCKNWVTNLSMLTDKNVAVLPALY